MPHGEVSRRVPASSEGPTLRDRLARILHVVDPTTAVCACATAEFLDLDAAAAPPIGRDDLLTMVAQAVSAGEAPIGPLRYRAEDPRIQVSEDGRTAWAVTEREPGVPDLVGVLDMTPTQVKVGGSRYGWIPAAGCVPAHILLPDFEAMVAELRVYAVRRALAIGYEGRVRITAAAFCDTGEPIVLRRPDETTGELLPDGLVVQEFEPLEIVYSMGSTSAQVRRHVYAFAAQMAHRFGASAPQFVADPDGAYDDDTPELLV